MGLKGYRKYKRNEEFKEFLACYGITDSDLRFLHEALAIVRELKRKADERPVEARPAPSEEQRKEFKERKDKALKPEDIVEMFKDDVEEFYPNGKGRA